MGQLHLVPGIWNSVGFMTTEAQEEFCCCKGEALKQPELSQYPQNTVVKLTKVKPILNSEPSTVWKLQDFSVFQILREINSVESSSSKKRLFLLFLEL